MTIFLPEGVAWVGFDETGRSVAASIEKRRPSDRAGSVMEGCARIEKVRFKNGDTVFGRDISDFEILGAKP